MFILHFTLLCLLRSSISETLPKPEKIVAGKLCDDSFAPYVVSIKAGFHMHHICGGSLINGHHALTAAHCAEDSVALYIVSGQSNFFAIYPEYFQATAVVYTFRHPNYQRRPFPLNDIAILRLENPIVETVFTKYVTLPLPGSAIPCDVLEVRGWGSIGENNTAEYRIRCANIPHITRMECQEHYRDMSLDDTLCTWDEKHKENVCYGDSGSPLLCGSEQRGLVSWSIGCANHPAVHTDVSKHIKFIQKSIAKAKGDRSYHPTIYLIIFTLLLTS